MANVVRCLLTPSSLRTALDIDGIALAGHSPLRALDSGEAAPAATDALASQALLVEDGGTGPRLNRLFGMALGACADPDDVVTLQVADERRTAVTFCRRGRLWVECSIAPGGVAHLAFPLGRDTVLLWLTAALSRPRQESTASGFAFAGDAADALVLSVAAEGHRAGLTPTAGALATAVAEAQRWPDRVLPLALLGGAHALRRLADDPASFEASVARLATAGHLVAADGAIALGAATATALAPPPDAAFTLERRSRSGAASGLHVSIAGGRLIACHVDRAGAEPVFRWREVSRAELRVLAASMLLSEEQLAVLTRASATGAG